MYGGGVMRGVAGSGAGYRRLGSEREREIERERETERERGREGRWLRDRDRIGKR